MNCYEEALHFQSVFDFETKAVPGDIYWWRAANMSWRKYVVVKQMQSNPAILKLAPLLSELLYPKAGRYEVRNDLWNDRYEFYKRCMQSMESCHVLLCLR